MSESVPENLARFFDDHPRFALAYSGGVDSSYLLTAATRCGAEVGAYTVESQFRSPVERANAREVADCLGVKPVVLDVDVLSDEGITANTEKRCYLCKRRVLGAVISRAKADGFHVFCDASNASDSPAERPGMRAVEELGVVSPLREAGISKCDVRRLSKTIGLSCWNAPSDSCLATRVATGTPITAAMLRRTEDSERRLRSLGLSGIRVRTAADGSAVLEIPESQKPIFDEHVGKVETILTELYGRYTVKERTAL